MRLKATGEVLVVHRRVTRPQSPVLRTAPVRHKHQVGGVRAQSETGCTDGTGKTRHEYTQTTESCGGETKLVRGERRC